MKNVTLSLIIAGLFTTSMSAMAVDAKPAPAKATVSKAPAVPKTLEPAVKAGLKVEKSFPAPSGLTGWVVSQGDGQYNIVYTTADSNTLIAGALMDATGKNITGEHFEKYVPKPDYEALFADIEKASSVTSGTTKDPKQVIYVFIDPNCIFCHYFWKLSQAYEKKGLQVKYLPVAFLKQDSLGKAAALLEAKDGAQALKKHETTFVAQKEEGGITPLKNPKPETLTAIQTNADLMRKFGMKGTPGIVYKDKSGKVMIRPGMINNKDLAEIAGIDEQPVTDKDLQRFK